MICKNCGFDAGAYKFCTNCGAEVTAEPAQPASSQVNYTNTPPNYNPAPAYDVSQQNTYNQPPVYGTAPQNTYNPYPGYGAPAYGTAPYAPAEDFNLLTAYKSFWKKYADFSGRSRRKEYWLAMLANGIILFALVFLLFFILFSIGMSLETSGKEPSLFVALLTFLLMGISVLYVIAAFVPTISMTVRRLHDSGNSGWLCILCFAINIVNLVFMCMDSQSGTNQYGPNPKGY